jgi:CRP/FNR family transcriptional regulator, anaerobic regulatory protein
MNVTVVHPLNGSSGQVECSTCHLREICLPAGLTPLEFERVDRRLVSVRRKVARGASLYRIGDRFECVYAVWTGFFKTCIATKDGRDQVTGFHMAGELLGLDGLAANHHEVDATALEDSQVCVIRFADLEALAARVPTLQAQLHRTMGGAIVNGSSSMLLLGTMNADERLAAFLLDLTCRLNRRGYSASSVLLRMSRIEIGSYLGLTLETVSRTFSRFQADGLLFVRNRLVRITDPVGLQQIVDGSTDRRAALRPAAVR